MKILNNIIAIFVPMGLSKKDLARKKRNLKNRIEELEELSKKRPLTREQQDELEKLKKKLKEKED